MSSKSWIFTLNNHDGDRDRQWLEDSALQHCAYMCFQRELAPTTGTPHLQGWLYLLAPRTMRGLKSTVFAPQRMQGVHLERARGSRDECFQYCSKEESRDPSPGFAFQEFGRFDDVPEGRGQGARNDLTAVARAVRDGNSLRQLSEDFPVEYIKFSTGITKMFYLHHAVPRPRGPDNSFTMPYVEWIYGPTGTGKTRYVYEQHEDSKIFRKTNGDAWFDGYHGQEVALFDDFRAKWFSFSLLLNLTDRYPLNVGVKGDTVAWSPSYIYFTCPKHPRELFSGLAIHDEGCLAQLTRRIAEIRYVGPPGGEFDAVPAPYADIFNH